MTNLLILARKIHRILVLIIITISLIMMTTGVLMKYSFMNIFRFDMAAVRYLHNQVSALFSFTLIFMIVTGSYLYIFPYLKKSTPK